MATTQCGRTATLNISEIFPGTGESWVAGDPVIDWGDGQISTNVTGTSISHTYTRIGSYNILLEGENDCGNNCSHTETVITLENPSNLRTSSITQTSARVDWNALSGATIYQYEIGSTVGTTSSTYRTFTGLTPNTTYTAYVSSSVSGYVSEDYCGNNSLTFKTLPEVCEIPSCDFTIST